MQDNIQNQNNNQNINSNVTKSVLVVSDLPENATKEDVEIFFENFKQYIVYVEIRGSKVLDFSNKSISATIIFNDNNVANKARLDLNLKKLKGKSIRITWHEKDNSIRYSNQFNLYIKNVPSQVTPREYFEYFIKFGDVISAKLAENDDGEHLGYGYVHYTNDESVKNCIEATDDKEIWSGSKIKVEQFQKKNERDLAPTFDNDHKNVSTTINTKKNTNTSVYVQNFPDSFKEKDFKENVFKGLNIISISISDDSTRNNRSAIVVFETEEDAAKAKDKNNIEVEDSKTKEKLNMSVDTYFTKLERKRYIYNKINEHNQELSSQYRGCNLYVKNLPLEMNNEELKSVFSQYGELKSSKIKTQIICTKVNNNIVEKETSCGFGYVCYLDPSNAYKAIEDLNGKLIKEDKFPDHKKPLEITYFTPLNERIQQDMYNNNNSNIMKMRGNYMNMPPMNNQGNRNMPYQNNYNNYNKGFKNNYYNKGYKNYNNNYNKRHNNNDNKNSNYYNDMDNMSNVSNVNNYEDNQFNNKKMDEPDYNILNELDDDASKKEYLGEFIFKKIEANELTEQHKITFEHIGKITGMILGIGDINEIIDICRSKQNLTSRILEALELLNKNA